MNRDKESYFINLFESRKSGIGDDGVLKEGFVFSQDAFLENVHFKREWSSLKAIAKKAMLVNISDAIAMNSKPLYALISASLPKDISNEDMDSIACGFKEVAEEFGIEIVGGDTVSNTKLDLSITIISKPFSRALFRKGLKIGQEVAYTGSLGGVLKELRYVLRGGKPSPRSKLIAPKLNPNFIYRVSRKLTSGMDISDGLSFELARLSSINRVGFELYSPIPKTIGCSGEEYEMLISYRPKDRVAIKRIAAKYRVKINIIGRAKRGVFRNRCRGHHF